MKNKVLLFILSFVFIGLTVLCVNLNISANTANSFRVEGAQVRTSGTAGIRFVGSIDNSLDTSDVTAYGIVLAYGEAEAEEVIIGATVNGKIVAHAEVANVTNNNKFYIVLINIPDSMYGQPITARAYIIKNGQTIYSNSAITRTLSQVLLSAKQNDETSDLIEELFLKLTGSYKNIFTDSEGNVYLSSSVYETNPAKLEEEFVSDWNKLFGTSWSELKYSTFQASAVSGSNPIDVNSTDCSGTNLYTFFNSNATTRDKWQWLLNYFIFVSGGKVHPVRQSNALLGDGTASDSYGSAMQAFMHLSASICNFFNGDSCRDRNNDIVFEGYDKYSSLELYNDKIYAINSNLVCVDKDTALDILTPANGYTFEGYKYEDITCYDSFTVVSDSIILTPQYTPIEYTLKFYDGEDEIIDLGNSYNIETETFELPSYQKDGYILRGWYTTSNFEVGTEVTEIEKGSIGNQVFYAKMEETSFASVNVTLNPSGGIWDTTTLLNNANILMKAKLTTYLSYESGGSQAGLLKSATPTWWKYIVLQATSQANLYEIVEIVDKNSKITESYDLLISWHANLNDSDSKTVLDAVYNDANNYIGRYVVLENIPANSSSSCNIGVSFIDSSEISKTITNTLIDTTTLPTPIKEGANFLGWKSSYDQQVGMTYPGFTSNPGDITYTALFQTDGETVNANVTFDYNGGATVDLYKNQGTFLTTLKANNYNGNYWTNYANAIFVYNQAKDPTPKFSTRIYVAENELGLYEILGLIVVEKDDQVGKVSSWPVGAEYVIIISTSYEGTGADSFDASKLSVGDVLTFSVDPSAVTSSSVATINCFKATIANDNVLEKVDNLFVLPTPAKTGYTFEGWYDQVGNLYDSVEDFKGISEITVTARWAFEDRIIGSFDDQSWVVVDKTIVLSAEYLNALNRTMIWMSNDSAVATVSQEGEVTGVSEGVAEIIVYDSEFNNISFTFYVTVVATEPTGILKVLLDSNNESIFTRDDLGVGSGTPAYYVDIVGSVSKLLFTPYKEYTTYYLSNPSKTSTLTGTGKGGVDFIVFHYAADMPYSANYSLTGGKNLASYNQTASGASWHYSTGNDGIWACQNTAYGAWHAGSSKTMTWTDSGLTTTQVGTDLYTTDVTLGNDGYFYIKGVKTNVQNTTGYKTLNSMGLGVKIVGTKVYLGGCYYNTSYKYISSTGGNNNSIGIESSVREASDLWLTWQYSAQLCAKLLLEFELPLNRLVGHHFMSGKDCPQPLLENDLEIWYEFVELTRQQMALYKDNADYTITMSTDSKYVNSLGRVTSLPTYDECITYTISYKIGSTTKNITLSTILPGTATK